jgi:hypothetical protein
MKGGDAKWKNVESVEWKLKENLPSNLIGSISFRHALFGAPVLTAQITEVLMGSNKPEGKIPTEGPVGPMQTNIEAAQRVSSGNETLRLSHFVFLNSCKQGGKIAMRARYSGGRPAACNHSSPVELCLTAIEMLDEGLQLPPPKLLQQVDEAENAVVHLRDCLIERLREEMQQEGVARWRKPLDHVNAALSLIAGVTYPATGIQHALLEDAQTALRSVQEELNKLGGED